MIHDKVHNNDLVGSWFKKINYDSEGYCKHEIENIISSVSSQLSLNKSYAKFDLFLEQIILNFYHVATNKGLDGVIFPRNANYWVKNNAYNPLQFSKYVLEIVDELEKKGFLKIHKGGQAEFTEDFEVSRCSILVPTDSFYDEYINSLIGKGLEVNPEISPIYVHEKINKKNRAILFEPFRNTISHKKLKVSYYLNTTTQSNLITEYNSLLSSFSITMDTLPDFKKAAFEDCVSRNGDTFAHSQFRRVFNRIGKTDFTHGGRWYGHWIQALYHKRPGPDGKPLKLRDYILVNNKPTVELDYKCLHANMLYACENVTPRYDDAYTVEGYEDLRNECKLALLIVFNSRDKESAIKALRNLIRKSNGRYQFLETDEILSIFNGLRKIHEPIGSWFFSGVGTRLQNIDSHIATNIIKVFLKQKKFIIPIHDSFIVMHEDKELLRNTMLKQYKIVLNNKHLIQID